MPYYLMAIVNTVVGTLFATCIGLTVAWMRARERAIRAELGQARLPRESDVSLERLQQTVEAIAVEVERISEGQRFTTKLLTDRSIAPAERPRAPGQVVTPH